MTSSGQEEYQAKNQAFYSAMIKAWINSKMERDKQLLGLSATGIGLLVTLLRTVGASNQLQIFFFRLALICFLITVISVIWILGQNPNHIEEILKSPEKENKLLECLDNIAVSTFIVAIVSLIIIGLCLSSSNFNEKENFNKKENTMSKEQQNNIQGKLANTNNSSLNLDSLNGIAKLRPEAPKVQSKISNNSSASNYPSSFGKNKVENNTPSQSDSSNSN